METETQYQYGVIDESSLTLHYPRAVDSEHESLQAAFDAALESLERGATEVAIVRARYSERHQAWVECDKGTISIDASQWRGDE